MQRFSINEEDEINTNSVKEGLMGSQLNSGINGHNEEVVEEENNDINSNKSQEKILHLRKGSSCWAKICLSFLGLSILLIASVFGGIFAHPIIFALTAISFIGILIIFILITCLNSFLVIHPNEAVVFQYYGRYLGTVKDQGYYYGYPCAKTHSISLVRHQYNGQSLKVNEREGNPVLVGIIVLWRVGDTAKAVFDVTRYEDFINAQGEAAIRYIGCKYPYEPVVPGEISLRGGHEIINIELKKELEKRVAVSGLIIEDARVTEVTYGSEIIQMMLQKQASNAVVAAKDTIIKGATHAVLSSLSNLEFNGVKFSPEEKANYIIEMMNTLCMDNKMSKIIQK